MPVSMLSITELQSGYGKKHVLHGVTLRVDAGEVVSLLGRNGMGKTTSLRTIMGLNKAWRGKIEFDGADITNAKPHTISQRGLGYVPEGRGVFPNLTVRENLDMAARPGRWTLERVFDVFPRLKERQTNWGNQLSGGEQQMVAIARALMLNPSLVML
jgi:branched-chain amino acid transport system ATP-binding protein